MTPTSVKITSRIRDYGNYIQKILELRANLKLRGGPLCTTNNSYSESLPSPGKVDDGYWNFFFLQAPKVWASHSYEISTFCFQTVILKLRPHKAQAHAVKFAPPAEMHSETIHPQPGNCKKTVYSQFSIFMFSF